MNTSTRKSHDMYNHVSDTVITCPLYTLIANNIHEDAITSGHIKSGIQQDGERESKDDQARVGSSERWGLNSTAVKRG